MKGFLKVAVMAAIAIPFYAAAADNITSKLTNKSNENNGPNYTLVQDKTLGEGGCVVDAGSKKVAPGESTTLTIKNGCTWGVVVYKVMKGDNSEVAQLSHSYRDGNFSIQVNAKCQDKDCVFYDLNPQQVRDTQTQH